MIIQIESNYIEGFIAEGKKKLVTFKNTENNLNITDDKMVIKLPKDKLNNYINKQISFAFRSKYFLENIFPFYSFRILVLKENDINLIYPLDSNIGNICLPEKDNNYKDRYYCYTLLPNNYKEFNLDFLVSTSNQNDNYNISLYKDYIEEQYISTKYYSKDNNDINFHSILFKFEFEDNEVKTILSKFSNDKDLSFPRFYSSQIYTLLNSSKEFNFNFNYGNCLLIFKYIFGKGTISFGEYPKIEANLNYLDKPITIPISEIKNITFHTKENFRYYLKLEYISPKSDIKELVFDESLNEILLDVQFPIYYYIKLDNQRNKDNNIDINFRIINLEDINTTSNILINGYMIDKDTLSRRLNGEFIELPESIIGHYDKSFKNGILQINETIINNYYKSDLIEYVLIKIDGEHYVSNSLSIEIIAMSNNNGNYLIPVNQYIMGYNLFSNITYLIKTNTIEENNTYIIVEYSPNYKDLNLNLEDISIYKKNIIAGTQKYIISNISNAKIFLNINKPERISNGNYLLRYYFIENNDEFEYKFDISSCSINKTKDRNNRADICFEFKNIEIYNNENLLNYSESNINEIDLNNRTNSGIRLKIYGSLFKREQTNDENDELLNTHAFISSKASYNNTEIHYKNNSKFELCFSNMSKAVLKYEMQIKINVIFNDYFFKEDSLVYTLPIDLTEKFKEEGDVGKFLSKKKIFFIIIILIIIIMLIFIILYIKLRRRNRNLENQVLSISLTNKTNEELFSEYSQDKKADPDYENTFI